ncbi:hypothetical protein ILYODFUR_033898, partial [Ilyodon furcidens]
EKKELKRQMDRRRTEKINQAKTKEKHLAEEEKIEINKSYVNEVVQNIKRLEETQTKRHDQLVEQHNDLLQEIQDQKPKGEELGHPGGARSRAAAPPHREGPVEVARASIPDASWTSYSRGVQGTAQDMLEALSLGWPGNALGSNRRSWRSNHDCSSSLILVQMVLQLQAAVEAEFQEKFQRLPGEIRDFLQDRKLEGRGHSKSRPSTPHEVLSEED